MSFLLYACTAGILSTFNPCAYTLLPAILSRFLAQGGSRGAAAGLGLGLVLGLGALTVFAAMGLLVALVGFALGRMFPYLALALALGFLVLGALSLGGRKVGLGLGFRAPEGTEGLKTYYLFGLAFGLASLGCTLPVFLTVAGVGLAQGAGFGAIALTLYGFGMGGVLVALSVATALGKGALLHRARAVGRLAEPLGGALLIAAGAYLIYVNLGYLTFDYGLSWRLGALSAGFFLLAGLALRYVRLGARVPS